MSFYNIRVIVKSVLDKGDLISVVVSNLGIQQIQWFNPPVQCTKSSVNAEGNVFYMNSNWNMCIAYFVGLFRENSKVSCPSVLRYLQHDSTTSSYSLWSSPWLEMEYKIRFGSIYWRELSNVFSFLLEFWDSVLW